MHKRLVIDYNNVYRLYEKNYKCYNKSVMKLHVEGGKDILLISYHISIILKD